MMRIDYRYSLAVEDLYSCECDYRKYKFKILNFENN